MELLTNTVPQVRFDYPDPTTTPPTATYSVNGGTNTSLTVTPATGYATAKLPYQASDANIKVDWSFTVGGMPYTQTQYYDIVTPLLSPTQVRDIIGTNASDDDVLAAEASARYIIQAYTGQSYGKYVGPLSITGSGDTVLRMPRRLITLNTINGNNILPQWVTLRGGGWFIVSRIIGVPTVRADYDGWNEATAYPGIPLQNQPGVIAAPPRNPRALVPFVTGLEYVVDGVWGWDFVPAPVQEAAKLLVNDYACGDSVYRDRYISSISGPDWTIRFNDGAFTSTGNVRADALLADYKLRRGWTVL